MTPEQIARLPRWAQDGINRLERENNRLTNALAALDNGSPVYYNATGLEKISLPARANVSFVLANGEIEVYLRDGEAVVCARSFISNRLLVMPNVANSITLKIQD